ncbi:NINE protein [Nodosilinea sp. LEGE 07088]|uniref:NINE protein n=1 Tax=Nodosilinea sp. LEGE 07088 TaxID=2777968 RepID=UPI001881B928|nr:NINE protein [Nodosilinea sp. LEGE 07088]MBE9136997.1 NINE protein [Nodosilinea sp. LEGE 07088]
MAQRNRWTAVGLAWLGVVAPVSGFHKFYLGQPGWGTIYLLLSWTPIPRVACAIEGFFWMTRPSDAFALANSAEKVSADPTQINALGVALRELDALRQEGLISELEFEQKRRQLLEQVS